MGPVTGMLALCALGCSALGLLLLPERGPSVQPCAMKGFNDGFSSVQACNQPTICIALNLIAQRACRCF